MDSRLNGGRSEVAFIDTAVSGWEALAEGVPAGIAVVLLDGRGDGLSQLADWAAGRAGHDAFHILSHGGDGYLKLGALTLDAAMLAERPGDLDMLGAALKPGGDILLYGCELAGEPAGNAWLDLFADLTGANVAASTNLTGATDLGGDFVLAARIGVVTTQGFDIPAFTGVLSTLDTLPTLTATGVTTTFVDESNALSLFSGSTASTNDAGQVFTSLTLTVTGVLDAYEMLGFSMPNAVAGAFGTLALVNGASFAWVTTSGSVGGTVSVTGTTATVTLSGFGYTASEMQSLVDSIAYNNTAENNSSTPSDGARVITLTSVTDDGASNNTASLAGSSATVNIGSVTPPPTGTLPTLTATGATATFAGSASPPDLFSSVAADTNDSGQLFTSLTLTVTGVLDAYEMLGFSMPNAVAGAFGTLALVNGASFAWVTTSGSVGGTVSVTGTTATVTLSGFGYTASEMQSLVDSIAYNNTAENNSSTPSDGARVITLTSVTDDGASNNTASLAGSSATVNIGNVTPPPTGTLPTLTATGATASYPQGTSTPVDLFSSVTADTNDVGQSFVGFSITISGLADMMEGLTVPGVLGGMSSAGGQVDVGGIPHGSYTASGSANAQTYDFAFTTPITAAQLQSIIDGIGYINQAATVTAGPRTITLNSVTDNGSSNNVASLSGISATVNVTVPNPPIVQSAAVDGSTLVLTYDQALDATNVAQVGTFGVNASGGMHPGVVIVTAVAVDSANKTVTLTLQRPILSTETVTVSYTDPTSGNDTLAVQNIDGDDAGSILNMAVTNNTSPPVGPALVSATVNYTSMTLTFDDFLDQLNAPLSMAFSVSVDSSPVAVSSVTVNNDKTITLALNAPVASGQTVTITYTDTPGDDLFAIQSTTGADTATFTNQSVTNNTPAAPALQSATVNGSTLVLTYDQMLDAINGPTGTNFSVMADSMLVTVTTATVDTNNMTVTLTLASPVAAGAVVTVTYIDPTTGDDTGSVIQSMGGIDAAGFTSQSVTNNTPGGPALVSATVDGATLTLTFDDFLDQLNAPQLMAFGVTVGGSPAIVNNVIVNADKTVTLTLTTPVTSGQIVTVSYTDPTAGNDTFAIQSATGSDASSFTGQSVTNNTVAPPALQSATIDGNTLVMTYDQALDGVNIPTSASFSVFVGAGLATITNVAIDGPNKTVTLTLSAPVAVGDTVAVSYTDPTAGDDVTAVQSTAGVDAASITSQPVTNNTLPATVPVYVSSVGYIGENTFTVTFDVALDGGNPPPSSAFDVQVNGTSVPVTGVTVNGVNKTVTLTLDSSALGGSGALTAGDIIDFIYTDPTAGNDLAAIQGTTGLDAANFTRSLVVAIARPAVAPSFVSAAVDGSSLVLTYDQALDALNGPAGTDFTVMVDSQSVNVTNVVIDGVNKTVTLTLATPVTSSQTVTVAYTDPTNGNDTNAIQSSGGLDAASLPATSVTNNTSAGGGDTPPTLTLTPENQGFWSLNGSTGYDLFDTVTASTVDNGQTFTGMVLKVYNVAYGTEYLNIGGTDITLAAGTGSVAGGSYAVTLANGVATVTLSGLSLSNSDMGTLIDGIAYKVTNNNSSIGQGYTRPVVLESVTDSGASNNTTTINEVATVTFVDSVMMPTFFLSTTPDSPTYNFTPGVPTQVTFTATVLAPTTMIGSMVTFSLGLPQGWTATPSGTVPSISGLLNLGTTYTLTYDITASGTDTSGAFPVSLIPQTTGVSLNYSAYSSSAMVTVGPPPAPAFVSAAVNGTSLVLTYDQALDALNAPAGTDFTVMVDSQSVNVTNVVIDGVNKTVTLTLATPVTSSQTVSVAYTDPTNGDDTNAIQGSTGVDAVSLPATSVTNNTPPPSAPLYVSSLAYIGENTITLTFDVALDGASPPAAGDFDVQVNGTGVVVSGVSVNGANKTVTLTLDTNPSGNLTLLAGDIIDFAYTDPTAGDDPAAIQGTTGIDAADFNQSFIVTTIRPVTFQSATVDGATLTMTYDQALASLPGPAPGAFTVMVGGNAVAVNSVLVDGPSKLVILSLATPVTAGQSVTVAYTDPSGSNDVNAIQDITGNDASSLTTTPVTNNTAVSTGNTPPLLHAVAANDGFQNGSGGSGVDLFNLTVADTLDIAQAFVGFTLTVHGVDGTANEKITIHGLDIDLVDGGSYNSPDLIYNVSVTGDIATVTFVGMTAQVNEITDRIDNLTYSNTGTLAGITPGDSAFRAIVLRSVRDSGGSDNVTQIEIATGVTIAQSAQGGGTTFGMVAKAIDPTVTFDGTTPQKVEFLVTLESALSVIGTTIGFAPALPTGWTAGPVVIEYVDPTTLATSSVAGITGLQTIGTMYKVSFDVTAIGSEVSGSFPIGLTSTVTAGILSEYPRLKSGVAMMSVELPPDVTPPDAPEITSSSLTKDDTPVISGTAEAGATIT
ncbi:SwmB domain-containing protein, partial [Niveispirillum fermenti]|uniref:SwmB domain-containing protein n=1 Tax=Niveispirillum fermenti TaxID=1233113 RepID=UPI003A864F6D